MGSSHNRAAPSETVKSVIHEDHRHDLDVLPAADIVDKGTRDLHNDITVNYQKGHRRRNVDIFDKYDGNAKHVRKRIEELKAIDSLSRRKIKSFNGNDAAVENLQPPIDSQEEEVSALQHYDWVVPSTFNIYFVLILVQVFCSCFAGVYNEYLLKSKGSDMDVQLQNSFMYINSILFNVLVLAYNGSLGEAVSNENISAILTWKVFPIIVNNAFIGIVTSLFLKTLDSILKVFASALELIFTALLSWILFGYAIDSYTISAIALVSAAIYVYSQNPVQNPASAPPPALPISTTRT